MAFLFEIFENPPWGHMTFKVQTFENFLEIVENEWKFSIKSFDSASIFY